MTLPIIFMFSGQGSQYYHMGRDLFNNNEIFRNKMLETDRICQDLIGLSVVNHIYNDQVAKSEAFTQTILTHPAIFMVEWALTTVLLEKSIHPDIVLGTSLGEITAAVVCGALSVESGMRIVTIQAEALKHCPEGGMLAILGDPLLFQNESYLNQFSELAAINFSSHFVVSGYKENLKKIKAKLDENNITSQSLPVSYAFHSHLIDNAKLPFLEATQSFHIKKTNIPLISCTEAKRLSSLMPNHFWNAARLPILFQRTIQQLESKQPACYLDVGPSGTLATFVKYNLSPDSLSRHYTILTPYGGDIKNLSNVERALRI